MPELPAFDEECFFIAPIGADGSDERRRSDGILRYIVSRAAAEVGLVAVRADAIAEPGNITLQVIEHVISARAAVVDVTGRNANVFYELGIRHAAQLPVVLISEERDLPFDVAQLRTIFFSRTDLESAEDCREQVAQQLGAAVSRGSFSPVSQAIDFARLQGGSSSERGIAEVVENTSQLARLLGDLTSQSYRMAARVESIDQRLRRQDVSPIQHVTDVLQALRSLPESERNVLVERFGLVDGELKTLDEIAKRLGMTRAAARRLEANAVATLRDDFGRDIDALSDMHESDPSVG